jgi:hypothetical protein
MQKTSYAPLIEFHGFTHSDVLKLKEKLSVSLKKELSKRDYGNLTFSEITTKVIDVTDVERPFIRMFSSDYIIIHKVVEFLKECKAQIEVEFIKITNYFDLRENK